MKSSPLFASFRSARPRRAPLSLAAAVAAVLATHSTHAGTIVTLSSGVDLTLATNYTPSTAPGATTDILFGTAYPAANASFQLGTGTSATSLSAESINSISTKTITIGNNSSDANASDAVLTLGNPAGQADAVTGSAAADLLYVGTGATLNFQGANLRNGQTTGTGVLSLTLAATGNFDIVGSSTISAAITGANGFTKTGAGTLILSGANTAFTGATAVAAGILQPQTTGTTNSILSLGTGDVTLSGGRLNLKANGSGNFQLITTGDGTTNNNVNVTASSTIDVNLLTTSNSNNQIVINNLALNGSTLTVQGANNYALRVAGATNITGAGTISSTTAGTTLAGKVTAPAATAVTITGAGIVRLTNTSGTNANSIPGTLAVTSGNLIGYAPAAGAAGPGSNSLGTATIALSGTNPTLRLAPSFEGGLTTPATAGLVDKSYNFTAAPTLATTNFLGATSGVTSGTTGTNPTGNQIVPQINLPVVATFGTNQSRQIAGLLNINTAGIYNFSVVADDGNQLYIDGNPAIGNATALTAGSTAAFYLTSGPHTITQRLANGSGSGGVVVSYQGPDQPTLGVIPASAFTNAPNADLATNFGNNVTLAATTAATIESASNTTLGSLTMLGTGAGTTLNVSGAGDLTSVTFNGAATLSDNLTLSNPTANVTVNGIATTGAGPFTLTKSGFGMLTNKGNVAPGVAFALTSGTLSLNNDGTGSNGTIAQGNAVAVTGTTTIDVRNNGTNTGNTIALGALTTPATATVTNTTFTGANGYNASFTSLALPGTTGGNTTLTPLSANVIIAGNVTNQMSGFGTGNFDSLILDGTTSDNRINGNISDAAGGSFLPLVGGYTRILKTNTSTWTLAGAANTYTGITQVQAGTLKSGANNVIPLTNLQGVQVAATGAGITGTYDFNGFNQTLNTSGGTGTAITLSGTTATSTPQVLGTNSTVTLNGGVTYTNTNNPLGGLIGVTNLDLGGGTRTFNVTDSTSAAIDLDVTSNLANGTLLKTSPGTMRLSGALDLTQLQVTAGNTILASSTLNNTKVVVNGGSVDLNGQTFSLNSFTLAGGGTVSNGTLTGSDLLKQGPGTLTLNVNAAASTVTVNQGLVGTTSNPATLSTLGATFGNTATNILGANPVLTLGGASTSLLGGGQLMLTGAAGAANSQSFSSTTLGGGTNGLVVTGGASNGTVAVSLGTITRGAGATLNLTLPTSVAAQSSTNGVIVTPPAGSAGSLLAGPGGTAYGVVGGTDFAAYSTDSPGNIVGANSAGSGGTSIYTAASSGATFTGHADITGSFTANTGASTVESIRFNGAASTLTLAGATTVNTGAILFGNASAGISNIGGGATTSLLPGAGRELVITSAKPNTLNTINTVLADSASGASAVTYSEAAVGTSTTGGIIDLKVNNTYTGPTYINSGRVATQSSAVTTPFGTGAGAIVYINGNTDGQFFNNQNTVIANRFVIVGNGLNENGSRAGVLRLTSSATATPTLSGPITLLGDSLIGNESIAEPL